MSDPRAPIDDLQQLAERIRGIEARLDRLATPSGSNLAQTVTLLGNFANDAERDGQSGFALSTADAVLAEEVFTAPDYPSLATVIVIGQLTAKNTTASADNIEARVTITPSNGSFGESRLAFATVAPGYWGFVAPSYTADVTLDPLETLTLRLEGGTTSADWAFDSANIAQVTYVVQVAPVI